MAARKNRTTLTKSWKDNIQASVLGMRLYQHALGEIEMKSSQIKAAQIILGKLVPDLGRTELAGDAENPLAVVGRVELVALSK